MSGIERLAVGIEAELARRRRRQRKTQRGKLALLVATMLSERSSNLMDLAAALPRPTERADMRYQWIARLLANPRVDCDVVMRPFAEGAVRQAGAEGGTVVLLLDQSKVSAGHQMLMVSVRAGERALPLAWRGRGGPGRDRLARAGRASGPCRWRGGSGGPEAASASPSSGNCSPWSRAGCPRVPGSCSWATASTGAPT